MALFETKGLGFTYPLGGIRALDGIDFTVREGELVLIMGRSGSGKTTLLKLLTPALAPAGDITGEISVNAASIGFVNQNPELTFVSENVRGELAFALENMGLSNDKIAIRIGEIASFFNLTDMLDRSISTLSGGARATVAIAAALINNSRALILDEPFSHLDPKASAELSAVLRRINTELGITVIMSSHTSAEVIDMCDRIVIMDKGKIICDDKPCSAVKRDELLPFFPICTALFDERPLTIKEAISLDKSFVQKPAPEAVERDKSVELKHITFAYSRRDRDILEQLSYTAYKGSVNSIIGANGSGKTTLLKLIAGVRRAYSGRVRLDGTVSYMPQNVAFMFTADRVRDEIKAETAEHLGLTPYLDSNPLDLSGGEAQRLALGMLIEQNADIFLLDEPTKSLDAFNRELTALILRGLANEGKTIILVSHDLNFVGEVSDYVSFLSDGIITMSDDKRSVLSSLDFYTSDIRRLTPYLSSAVCTEDII